MPTPLKQHKDLEDQHLQAEDTLNFMNLKKLIIRALSLKN